MSPGMGGMSPGMGGMSPGMGGMSPGMGGMDVKTVNNIQKKTISKIKKLLLGIGLKFY